MVLKEESQERNKLNLQKTRIFLFKNSNQTLLLLLAKGIRVHIHQKA